MKGITLKLSFEDAVEIESALTTLHHTHKMLLDKTQSKEQVEFAMRQRGSYANLIRLSHTIETTIKAANAD